jgi:ABC-2 type transport system permease protein
MKLKHLLLIAFKDLRLIFRDRSALVLMLLAPFLLTLGMGALTGRFSGGNNSVFGDIPVLIVNADQSMLGDALVAVLQSPELADLLAPEIVTDPTSAKGLVDNDQSAALIVIPKGFTESVLAAKEQSGAILQIEFYANPTRPNSTGLLRTLLDQFLNQVEIGRVSAEVIVAQLIQNGLIPPEEAASLGARIGQEMGSASRSASSIRVVTNQAETEAIAFDILAYMAPGMAMMFLMFTVTYGARSLLVENREGTLSRLLIAPTSTANVLGGKFVGIFFTAISQLGILIGGTTLLFGLQWGDALGVILLILAAAFGATGWGVLFAAILKTPGQVAVTGSAVMLIFGLLGGSFFDISLLPSWVQTLNKITPNIWANTGFYILSAGGRLKDIQSNILALLVMGLLLFSVAVILISKRGLMRK